MNSKIAIPIIAGIAGLIAVFVGASLSPSGVPDNPFVIWVAMNTTQCANPWDEEQQTVGEYFGDRGILIYGQRSISYLDDSMSICSGCSCKSGSTLYLQVAEHDSNRMINEYGFVDQSPKLAII